MDQTIFSSKRKWMILPCEVQGNARFAAAIDNGNEKLQERKRLIDQQRSKVRAGLDIWLA